jgi:hypothetical protein
MMDDGIPLEEVERSIDATAFTAEEKAALWLLAWSLEEPHFGRAPQRPALQLVTAQPGLESGGLSYD